MRSITTADELHEIIAIERALVILFHNWSHVPYHLILKSVAEATPRLLRAEFSGPPLCEIVQIDLSNPVSELTTAVRKWLTGQRVGDTAQPGLSWRVRLRNWWSSERVPDHIYTAGAGTILWCEFGQVRSLHGGGLLTPD